MLVYLGIVMLHSYAIVEFYLFYDMSVDMQIWAFLSRSQCRVSDTQVTDKASWPLVFSKTTGPIPTILAQLKHVREFKFVQMKGQAFSQEEMRRVR